MFDYIKASNGEITIESHFKWLVNWLHCITPPPKVQIISMLAMEYYNN